MPYSKDQISNINQRAIAVPRKKYVLDNGDVYIGLSSGRLQKRDIGLNALKKEVSKLPTESTIISTSTATLGNKYKISPRDNRTIEESYDYYIHANFEITPLTTFTILAGGQLSLGDGSITNNGTLMNKGTIIS